MLLLVLFVVLYIYVTNIVFKNNSDIKIIMYLFIIGLSIYSGLGIVIYNINNKVLYLFEFMMFSMFFFIVANICKEKTTYALKGIESVYYEHQPFIYTMAIIYLIIYIYPLVLGRFTFRDLINISSIFSDYHSTPFSLRVARKSNMLYIIITNQVRGICSPFFYLLLNKIRKKPMVFILTFLFPVLLKTVSDGYLSRNNIVVYLAFIFIYLISERIINKKIAISVFVLMTPIILSILNLMSKVRSGGDFNFSLNTITENIRALIDSECSYPIYFNICDSMYDFNKTINFFVYILLVVIPSQFYSLIGLTIPNLAYSFTENVLGMSYGAQDYYIVLPSVLGEAIILFGKYFAWIYGGIYAIFIFWFLRVLSSHRSLKYLKLYFVLDFFRQFRGGSQYVLSTWMTTIVPFIIIVSILSKYSVTKEVNQSCLIK